MPNSQLSKLKSTIKIFAVLTLKHLSNIVFDSNYFTNFPHKLLIIDRQILKLLLAGKGGQQQWVMELPELVKEKLEQEQQQ